MPGVKYIHPFVPLKLSPQGHRTIKRWMWVRGSVSSEQVQLDGMQPEARASSWCPVSRQFKKLYTRGTVAAGSLQASARTVKGLVITVRYSAGVGQRGAGKAEM